MDFIQAKYPENKNYLEIVKRSAFANEHNEIVQDHYQISANSKLCIIPPVGGG
jgi:molybdopterin converting factor small subunit